MHFQLSFDRFIPIKIKGMTSCTNAYVPLHGSQSKLNVRLISQKLREEQNETNSEICLNLLEVAHNDDI